MKATWDSVEGASGYMLLYGPLVEDGQLNEKEVLSLSCMNYEKLCQDFNWPSTGHLALHIQENILYMESLFTIATSMHEKVKTRSYRLRLNAAFVCASSFDFMNGIYSSVDQVT